jgi:hypothetical protein
MVVVVLPWVCPALWARVCHFMTGAKSTLEANDGKTTLDLARHQIEHHSHGAPEFSRRASFPADGNKTHWHPPVMVTCTTRC